MSKHPSCLFSWEQISVKRVSRLKNQRLPVRGGQKIDEVPPLDRCNHHHQRVRLLWQVTMTPRSRESNQEWMVLQSWTHAQYRRDQVLFRMILGCQIIPHSCSLLGSEDNTTRRCRPERNCNGNANSAYQKIAPHFGSRGSYFKSVETACNSEVIYGYAILGCPQCSVTRVGAGQIGCTDEGT